MKIEYNYLLNIYVRMQNNFYLSFIYRTLTSIYRLYFA